jgi:hypothetical protein
MRRPQVSATIALIALLAAPPARAAPPALAFGLIAGMAAVAILGQTGQDAWAYSDRYGWVGGAREDVSAIDTPLAARPGTSQRIVNACRDAVAKNAGRYDVASLEAVSAGRQARVNKRTVAPIEVRAIYRVRGVHEVKRTHVRCEIDRSGRVIATS